MKEIIREAALGQFIRLASGNRFLRYPEEEPGFVPVFETALAPDQNHSSNEQKLQGSESPSVTSEKDGVTSDLDKHQQKEISRPPSLAAVQTQKEQDVEGGGTVAIEQTLSTQGKIVVTWYGHDDPANPQNWSKHKKNYVMFLIWIYTFAVYASSSIYTSGEEGVMAHFGVGPFKASLGLALYVLGYGIGPLLFSPLSEIPAIGRNIPYISTFALFVILSIPTAVVDKLGGLLFLRFLQGFFGSPCLATGAATLQDVYSMLYAPIAIALWVSAAFSGPALGPVISGFAVSAKGWRWSLWEIVWMSAPVFVVFFISMPETLADYILLQRARRLRKLTGDERYVSISEIKQSKLKVSEVLVDALVKPFEINIKDPAIAYTSLYSGIIYAIYYSFFEVFPLVYGGIYNFNIGEIGATFTCIAVALALALAVYLSLFVFVVIPEIKKNGPGPNEDVLKPGLIFIWGPVIALFGFAWTSRASIHWIVPTIFLAMYPFSAFIVLQGIFAYLPLSYPKYAASLFAFNDFVRSLFAFGCVMFARGMYVNLGIGKGVSLVGGLSILGPIGIYILYIYGARLRARSNFAVK